jgi:hypothetical protein
MMGDWTCYLEAVIQFVQSLPGRPSRRIDVAARIEREKPAPTAPNNRIPNITTVVIRSRRITAGRRSWAIPLLLCHVLATRNQGSSTDETFILILFQASVTVLHLPPMLVFDFLLMDLVFSKRVLVTWPVEVDDVARLG